MVEGVAARRGAEGVPKAGGFVEEEGGVVGCC